MRIKPNNVENLTSVTYSFVDGTKVVSPVSKGALVDNRNKKRSYSEMIVLFQQSSWDKGAISFTLDAEEESIVNNTKEIYFTSKERKYAKKDYKDFKSSNPQEFFKQQQKFRAELIDKLSNKLRFNLTKVSYN